jgi:catechol 2,3-dioxygenase-like lactoylglutathione lyase family enzyme
VGIEVNGIAHIQLTVNRFDEALAFYEQLLPFLGLQVVVRDPKRLLYCIGGRTAVAVARSSREHRDAGFDQRRVGLHHLCFRARAREDVDALHAFLQTIGARIVHPPEDGPWAPGYYSMLFEDPDGIRLEINHVPGAGHLSGTAELPFTTFPGFERYPSE